MNNKIVEKRLILGLIQNVLAFCMFFGVAIILFNSYLTVGTMSGQKVLFLDAVSAPENFEDSELFDEIFHTSIADITKLAVIKGQLETEGELDLKKGIDITKFAEQKSKRNACPITAVYKLEDLINWGKYGIEYTSRAMSISDFVAYFGSPYSIDHFALDDDGRLYFAGYEKREKKMSKKEKNTISAKMNRYTQAELEEMIFSYIIARTSDEISVVREDDSSTTVYIHLLSNRYKSVDGSELLLEHASNWIEYMQLQENLEYVLEKIPVYYEQYMNCNFLYQVDDSNMKYAIRMMTKDGNAFYTNDPELQNMSDGQLTDHFTEFRRYMTYYPDNLEFLGNTNLTEKDIYSLLNESEFAFPETTHIWVGVDTDYKVTTDAFGNASQMYKKIVPYINFILFSLFVVCVGWLVLGIWITLLDSAKYNGSSEGYLYKVDYVWTEGMVLFMALFVAGVYYGYQGLSLITKQIHESNYYSYQVFEGYMLFGLYGFTASLFVSNLWYGFVRRVKAGNLWKDSFICLLSTKIGSLIRFTFSHPNTIISTFLPYNMFLLANILMVMGLYKAKSGSVIFWLLLIIIAVFNSVVGYLLFRHSAEQMDVVNGIEKIREGEVDYKIESEHLHGSTKEVADAVNHIGEGLKTALATSVKDEKMKTDLITNVSHDIKTPLTSIINYVDLMKRLHVEEEPLKTYIDVLNTKTHRLKQLTDDLVEASKISSGNIELIMEPLNLTELLYQAIGEFSDKFEDNCLQVVFPQNNVAGNVYADSRRMWRVAENLFNNICKYALENTRVYVDLKVADGQVIVEIKNISKRQMNVSPEELTERFIRGDVSRSTEGSGLGLSIAKSLVSMQGGVFSLECDGDLFKVSLTFPEYVKEVEVTEETQVIEEEQDVRETEAEE